MNGKPPEDARTMRRFSMLADAVVKPSYAGLIFIFVMGAVVVGGGVYFLLTLDPNDKDPTKVDKYRFMQMCVLAGSLILFLALIVNIFILQIRKKAKVTIYQIDWHVRKMARGDYEYRSKTRYAELNSFADRVNKLSEELQNRRGKLSTTLEKLNELKSRNSGAFAAVELDKLEQARKLLAETVDIYASTRIIAQKTAEERKSIA